LPICRERARQLQEELLEEGKRKAEALEAARKAEAAVQNPPPPERNGDDRRYRDRDAERSGRGGDIPRHSEGRRDGERDRARHGHGDRDRDRDRDRRHDADGVGPPVQTIFVAMCASLPLLLFLSASFFWLVPSRP
jgi:hypothetical protein